MTARRPVTVGLPKHVEQRAVDVTVVDEPPGVGVGVAHPDPRPGWGHLKRMRI